MRRPRRPDLLLLAAIPVFWLLDALADALVFGTCGFGQALWPSSAHHLFMRIVTATALAAGALLLRAPAKDRAGSTMAENPAAGADEGGRGRAAGDILQAGLRCRLAEAFLLREGNRIFDEAVAVICAALDSPAGLLAVHDEKGLPRVMSLQKAPGLTAAGRRYLLSELAPALAEVEDGDGPRILDAIAPHPAAETTFDCLLAAPLAGRERSLGLVAVGNRARPYAAADVALMATLAGYLGPLLQAWTVGEQKETQALHAKKMEALGALAGGIAHDFNNILQAILGFAAMARDEIPPGSRTAGDLDRVLRAAERGRDLVQRILLASRTEDQERHPVDLRALLQETGERLRRNLPAGVALRQELAEDPCRVSGDPAQLRLALWNLATNALHAMEDAGGTLTFVLCRVARVRDLPGLPPHLQDRQVAVLKVCDTGSGMDEATLARLFDPFFTTKTVGRGTGLGLPVVHGIISAHQGGIHVDSRLGQGTTVTIYLPLEPSAGAQAAPEAPGRTPSS